MFYAPAKKSIEISLPWHSSTIPIVEIVIFCDHGIADGITESDI